MQFKKGSDKKQIFFSKNHRVSSPKNSFFSKNHKAQVWVETVVYTLIAFVMIGLVLAYAKPKIEEIQDKAIIEQSLGVLEDIDNVLLAIDQCAGNTRLVKLNIKKGVLKIDGVSDEIIFEIEGRHTYSEPGEDVNIGGIEVHTEKKGKLNIVTLTNNYSGKYDITYRGADELKLVSKAATPFNLLISNKGREDNKTLINIQIVGADDELSEECIPDCGTRECGPAPNGCGGVNECGTCNSTSNCISGICKLNPTKFLENLGAISWWRFEGNALDEIGGNDGTIKGADCSVDGKYGQACSFDGSNSYVDITINIPSTITISTWATYTGPGVDMLWCIGNSGTGGPDLFFGVPGSGVIALNTWDSWSNPFCNVLSADFMEEWHLYTTVIDPAGTRLYIDDQLCGTAAYRNPTKTSFAISSSNGYDWVGKIDEPMIFNKALSDSEIQQLYNLNLN